MPITRYIAGPGTWLDSTAFGQCEKPTRFADLRLTPSRRSVREKGVDGLGNLRIVR